MRSLKASSPVRLLLLTALLISALLPEFVEADECPEFPKQRSVQCPPHSAVDQCKYDADCPESGEQCCLIGCQKMCLNPKAIREAISGNSVCPVLPMPSPCPNKPNECTENTDECGVTRKCCSDGCRMVCAQPVIVPTSQPPTTSPWTTCNTIVDVAFIIDSSGSIGRRNYGKIQDFVKNVARGFEVSPSGSRAGIILYSNSASVKVHFDQYATIDEFTKAVDKLPHERGLTYIDKALRLAASELFPRARKNVPWIAMLLTDGEQTDPDGTVNLRAASAPLRRQGVRVIAFGVGKNINVRELRLTVERDEDVIQVQKFDYLLSRVKNYTSSLCQASVTQPIHPDADIIFLVDSSTGVSSQEFVMEKRFVRAVARSFIVSPLGPRAAFVIYSSTSYTVVGFSSYSSNDDFDQQIQNAPFQSGGRRRIDQVLIHTATMFQETGRVGLRIIILLTAGNYYLGSGAKSISSIVTQMQSLDAHIYVVGIGSYFTPSMFKPMVRSPGDIFEVSSFNELANWQSRISRSLRLSTNIYKYESAYWSADVIFLLDSSGFVLAKNLILEKNFVKLMARLLNLEKNRTRAALFAFGDNPELQISFDGYEDREAFDAAVNTVPHLQGNRHIDKAFQSAADLLRSKSRPTVPSYVVLLTTGTQTLESDTRSLANASQEIRKYGGRIFVVAVLTDGYKISDFYAAVQRPEDAFSLSSFVELLPRAPSIAARMIASWRAPARSSFAADIVFIVDSTSVVTPFQFTRAKRFVRIISEYLNISPGKSRGAMVTFGETPLTEFNFDSYNSTSEFHEKVSRTPYMGGKASLSSSLRVAGTLFSAARSLYPWIVIFVTPWRPDNIADSASLENAARPLLNRGVWLYVLSIHENPYVDWLRPMVVDQSDAFSVVSYRDLPASIGPLASHITNDNYLYGTSSFELDMLFILDTSSGVSLEDYDIQKAFVQRITMHLGIFNRQSRAAVVAYGANSFVVFSFGGYNSNMEFARLLKEARMFGGERRVDRALDTASAVMLNARSSKPKVVLLITAGKQSNASDVRPLKDAVLPLRHLGAWLYLIAFGQEDASDFLQVTIKPTDIFFSRFFSSPAVYGYIAPVARHIANTSVVAGTSLINADIVFVIDCSSSVPFPEYSREKSFVRSLGQYLNIQPAQSRAALVVYGSRPLTVIRLSNSQTFARFESMLTKAPFLGGARRYDKALDSAGDILTNARENVPKIMLLFVAGKQAQVSGSTSLKDAVRPLRQQGVTTFIFRIGSEPGIQELYSAVESPDNVFTFLRFADMDSKVTDVARHIPFYSAILAPFSFAVDVVYLVDSSDPVTPENFNGQKSFVKKLGRYLDLNPFGSRGAIISYGSTSTVVSKLGDTTTLQAFISKVNNASKVGGQRRMDRAIKAALGVFNDSRPAIPKVVILLTTGGQPARVPAGIIDAVFEQLYDQRARLYAVTINAPTVLLPLHSSDGSDWFPVTSYRDLPTQVLPLARHVAIDTAALGPDDFVADVIFILDSSSSVTPDEFEKAKEFVKLIARYLNIAPGKSRGSVIIFSSTATPVLPFDGYTTMSEYNAAVDRVSQSSGSRRIDLAFRAAASLFQGARPTVRKIAILLTGGRQTPDGGSLQEAIWPINNLNVTSYVVPVGTQTDVPVARSEDVMSVTSYDDLPKNAQRIARSITTPRELPTPTAKLTTTPLPLTPEDYSCTIDLAFIVDASGSVADDWNILLQFVENVAKRVNMGPQRTHIAVVRFGDDSEKVFDFREFNKTSYNEYTILNKITSIPKPRGGERTFINRGLRRANREVFRANFGMRPSVRRVALLITDGKQTQIRSPTEPSQFDVAYAMRKRGIELHAMGIGQVDPVELSRITNYKAPERLGLVRAFESLQGQVQNQASRLCPPPPTAKLTTTPAPTTPDPCQIEGCSALYNIGCRVVNNTAECVCPSCPSLRRPICASDDVQDLTECHMRRQACLGDINVTVDKDGPCDKECRPILDIAFIIDSSGSIGRRNWERVKRFVKALVSKLDVSYYATRVAAIAYSTDPEVVIRFNDYQGTDEVNRRFDGIKHQRGFTYTDKALQLADTDLFQTSNGMRLSAPKLAVVITDGNQTKTGQYTSLPVASQGIKNKGITVYAVGVGKAVIMSELSEIASSAEYVITSPSFKDLQKITSGMRRQFCEVTTPTPTLPETTTAPIIPETTPAPTPGPCQTKGCDAPYNVGCQAVGVRPVCICPNCSSQPLRPICASDDVQDLTECHMRQQACLAYLNITVDKQGPCDKECKAVVDIAFIIDSSGSISRRNWERVKRFVKATTSKLDVSSSGARIAAIAYSTNPKVVMRFNKYRDTDEVNRGFDGMKHQRGFTYTDKALQLAERDVFQTSNGMRINVPKLAVVITDGKQTKTERYTPLSEASQGIKNKSVTVYAVGIGKAVEEEELLQIASASEYVRTTSSFEDLQKLASEIRRQFCESSNDQVTTPAATTKETTPAPTTPDLCQTEGCNAPYNIGCRVVNNTAECICPPPCPVIRRPICATDDVQDLSECHMRRQACLADLNITVEKRDPCENECATVVDIAFIIDSSGSISRRNWERVKRFVKAATSKLDVSSSGARIAAIAYSTDPEVLMRFNDYQGTDEVNRGFDGMRHQRGYTYTDKALELADRDVFQISNGMRFNVPKLAVVITDGNQTKTGQFTPLAIASQGIKNKGVTVYAVGVGKAVVKSELLEIASGPGNVLSTSSFEELQKIASELRRQFCEVPTPTPIKATTAPTTPVYPTTRPIRRYYVCPVFYDVPCPGDHMCEHDRQCGKNQKCCKHSCGYLFCSALVTRDKLGSCPYISRPPSCSSRSNECKYDVECKGDLKCCDDGCGNKSCASTSYTPSLVVPTKTPRVTTPAPTTSEEVCPIPMDTTFVIDSSVCDDSSNWNRLLYFIQTLVTYFNVSPSGGRIALIQFSTGANVVLKFNTLTGSLLNDTEVNRRVGLLQCQGGFRRIDKALDLVETEVLTPAGGVRDISRPVLVITSGKQTTDQGLYTPLDIASSRIQSKGAAVFVLGIGKDVDTSELTEIASSPDNIFTVDSFEDLYRKADEAKRGICILVTPAPTSPFIASALKSCPISMDTTFIIDSSVCDDSSNWNRLLYFVQTLVNFFNVSPSGGRIALITFNSDAKVVLKFNTLSGSLLNSTEVNRLVSSLQCQGGLRRIDKALELADKEVLTPAGGMRNISRPVLVITTGKQTTGQGVYTPLDIASSRLQKKGAAVFVLGIGNDVDSSELNQIASGPNNVFTVDSYKELNNKADEAKGEICILVPTATPQVTTPTPTTPDPCQIEGCSAPYNIGCRVVNNTAQCICPTCPKRPRPICASDDVQDLTECHMRRQACLGDIIVTVAKQSPCDKECNSAVDIAFIIDSSGSIGRKNWERVKRFVKALVSKLDVSNSTTRVAAIAYSTDPEVVMRFNDYQGTDEVNRRFDAMRYQRGYTYTDKALQLADSDLFQTSNGMRLSVPKLAVVITDGNQTKTGRYTRLSIAVQGIKNKGVTVYAVGVGRTADRAELLEIASAPKYVFRSQSFKRLQNLTSGLRGEFCVESLPTTSATPPPFTPEDICPIPMDTTFIIDSSDCDDSGNWNRLLYFVQTLVTYFNVSPSGGRIALIQFSTDANVVLKFNTLTGSRLNGGEVNRRVGLLQCQSGFRRIDKALDLADRDVLTSDGGVRNISRPVLVITTGKQTTDQGLYTPLDIASSRLQKKGAAVFVLGIGKDADTSELTEIASSPGDVFTVDSFRDLYGKTDEAKRGICIRVPAIPTPTLAPPAPESCPIPMDTTFIIDSSVCDDSSNWNRLLYFVQTLVNYFNVSPSGGRIALITFSTDAKAVLKFNTLSGSFLNSAEINRVVGSLQCQRGYRRIDKALDLADKEVLSSAGGVRDVSKPILVITTGKQTKNQGVYMPLDIASSRLQNKGAVVFVLGIGNDVEESELNEIASSPKDVFRVDSYKELSGIADAAKGGICIAPTATAKVTTPSPTTPDPCLTESCNTPYNLGCRVVNNTAECICPTCSNTRRPVCASDDVQDVSECHLRQQACLGNISITVDKQGPCDKECSSVVDIAFIIDSSGSIGRTNWVRVKRFVKSLVSKLDVSNSATRVAAIAYSTDPEVVMRFNDDQGTDEVNRGFDGMRHQRGYTFTDKALELADNDLFQTSNGMRLSVPKLAVVITDGNQTKTGLYTPLTIASRGIKRKGVTVYAVGVGRAVGMEELLEIASAPKNVFTSPSFQGLQSLTSSIRRQLCVVPTPAETTPRPSTPGDICPIPMDTTFIVDTSNCDDRSNWNRLLYFLQTLVTYFNVSPSGGRIAIISYSTDAKVVIKFNTLSGNLLTSAEAIRRVGLLQCQGGGFRRIDKALDLANKEVLVPAGGLRGISRPVLVITTGKQTAVKGVYTPLDIASSRLQNKGAAVFVLGIGSDVDSSELNQIASEPNNVFTVDSFKELFNKADEAKRGICILATPTPTLVTSTSAEEECPIPMDTTFIIDSSLCDDVSSWNRLLYFVQTLISFFNVSSSGGRIALIEFSTEANVVLRFNTLTGNLLNDAEVNKRVGSLQCQSGLRRIDKALELAKNDVLTPAGGMRDVSRPVLVITTGKQTTNQGVYTPLDIASLFLQSKGAAVFVLGIGKDVDNSELNDIASSPDNVFTVDSFQDLDNKANEIKRGICILETTPTPTPDPCQTKGCSAPYNIGCEVINNTATCVCPTCPNLRRPVCASDDVQDLSECHMRRQACLGDMSVTVSTQGPCDKECDSAVDIAFIIDSSGSIGRKNWERVKRFVKALVSKLDVSNSTTRVAAISYSTNPDVVMRFNDYQGTDEVNRGFDGMKYQRGYTYTDKALQLADQELFQTSNGMRKSVPKLAVVITDGNQTKTGQYTRLTVASQGIKNKGVTVYAVGVGKAADMTELREIATAREYVFTSPSFKGLQNITSGLRDRLCLEPTPTPSNTAPAPTTPEGGICPIPMDTTFIIDSSVCDESSSWNRLLYFIQTLVTYFNVSPSGGRVALIHFSTDAKIVLKFNTLTGSLLNSAEVNKRVGSLKCQSGFRRIDRALDLTDKEVFTPAGGMRNVSKPVLVITTGRQTTDQGVYTPLDIASSRLKSKGAAVFVLSIGKDVDSSELNQIASAPGNIFKVDSFRDLYGKADEAKRGICILVSATLSPTATPSPTTPAEVCPIPMDTTFIIDSSLCDDLQNWESLLNFVQALVSFFNVSPSGGRIALISFSSDAKVDLKFNTLSGSGLNSVQVNRLVGNLQCRIGLRRIDKALDLAEKEVFSPDGVVRGVSKPVLVITTGKQTNQGVYTPLDIASARLQRKGAAVFVLGIGEEVDTSELNEIASRPNNVFTVDSFADLDNKASEVKRGICVLVPTPTSTERTTTPPKTTPAADPCQTEGCSAPYNIGCDVINNTATCVCPTCRLSRRPVCASDDVQDLSECHMRRQACLGDISITVVKQGPCDKECTSAVDIAFIIDSSGSIGRRNWERVKRFVKALVSKLDFSNSATRVAAIAYSTNPEVVMQFNDYQGTDEVNRGFDGMMYQRGYAYTDKALKLADQALFQTSNGMRISVPKLAVVITDGNQTKTGQYTRLAVASQGIKNKGVAVYAVGVGKAADMTELREIASAPEYVFTSPSFKGLNNITSTIRRLFCDVFSTPTPKETTTKPNPEITTPSGRITTKEPCTIPTDIMVPEYYKAEVIYVLDSSSFVGPENYQLEKDFIKALALALNHSPTRTKSAVIIFDSFSERAISMEDFRDIDRFSEAVDNLRYLGGGSQLVFALTFAAIGFSFDDLPKVIVVVTNKDLPRSGSAESLGGKLRREGKVVNIVGVGNGTDFLNLRRVATEPENVFSVTSFDELMCYVPRVASKVLSQTLGLTTTRPTKTNSTSSSTTTSEEFTSTTEDFGTTQATSVSTQRTTTKESTPSTTSTIPSTVLTSTAPSTIYPPTPPTKTDFCPVVFTVPCPGFHRCEHDRQCPGSQRCCKHSCGFLFCSATVKHEKSGTCPHIPPPPSCSSRPKECNYDMECRGKLKCCYDGCGNKKCVPTDYKPQIGVLANRCPPYSPYRKCPSSVQDECTCDSDCDQYSDYKCCFDGCRRLCRTKAGQICSAKVDIIYLMDSSGSIGIDDFERQKDFVVDLARIFQIGPGASRAAVVTYHDWPTVRANFDDYDTTDSFVKAVDSINQTRGRTRIDRALKQTSEMFKSARNNVVKVLIALTDGAQTPDPDAMPLDAASQLLRDQGVKVYSLGVGHAINKTQLRSMVESDSDVFLADSFTDLLRKSQEVAEKACSEIRNKTSCVNGVDIAFLMDSSESITDQDFEREKTAVKAIAQSFLSASRESRAGVIMYSGQPELSVDFTSQEHSEKFNSSVDSLFHRRSETRIDRALNYASKSLFLNPRRSVMSIAVVMTDGIQTPGPGVEPLGQAVLPLRNKGVRVLAVGVGPRVDRNELKEMVTSEEDVFLMSSFQELLEKSAKLLETVCPQTTPPDIPSTKPGNIAQSTTAQPPSTAPKPSTAAPTTIDVPTCDTLFDVVFVIDSSQSIDLSQYNREKDFVKKLATIFNVGRGSRASVIIYSEDPQLEIQFGQYNNLQSFLLAVDALPHLQQRTRIDKALALANQTLQQVRPGFPKVVIVLTDGVQTQEPGAVRLDEAAAPIHGQGARVFVVGTGSKISMNKLRMIAKDPANIFTVMSFEKLETVTRDLAASACLAEDNTTTSPPVRYCPTETGGGNCSSSFFSCLHDGECPSGFKCCVDRCGGFACLLPEGVSIGTTPSPLKNVTNVNADIIFLTDSSQTVSREAYRLEKSFVKVLAQYLNVSPGKSRGAFVTYGSTALPVYPLGTTGFYNYIDGARYVDGVRRLDVVLQDALQILSFSREEVPSLVVLITIGNQALGAPPAEVAARQVGNLGGKLFVIMVGSEPREDEFLKLVENRAHLFRVPSVFGMASSVNSLALRIEEILRKGSQPQCAEAFDLGFVVDSSGSIQDMNYKKQKDFIKGLANALTVSPQTVQLGLILFSDVPLLSITFGTLTSTNYSEFAKAVDHMIYLKGRTRIDRALQVAVTNLFPGGRQNRMPQILFLITDGRHKSNDLGAVGLEQAVQPLKDKKIKVIVVGVGDDVDEDQLKSLVENPLTDLFLVTSFDDLNQLLLDNKLKNALCSPRGVIQTDAS